jgi:hypothetical protein
MRLLARFRSRFKWMLKPRRLEDEMEAEVRFHLESYTADLVRNGVPELEAMRRARIEFGGIESHKDAMRASRACASGVIYAWTCGMRCEC